jgi:predicted dehydrogenase
MPLLVRLYVDNQLFLIYPVICLPGASMLEIGIGHQMDIVTHVLGEFSSVSATTTTAYPVVKVVDASGKPTGGSVISTISDHIAFSGELKSGAVASVIWRSGYSSTKGRKQLLWVIDGDNGSITMESDGSASSRFSLEMLF